MISALGWRAVSSIHATWTNGEGKTGPNCVCCRAVRMPAARGIVGGAKVAIEDQAETEAEAEDSGTGRLEAFSDGVFAIAVTLLVLQLKVPDKLPDPRYNSLASYVLHQWPAFVAYFNSFLTIL